MRDTSGSVQVVEVMEGQLVIGGHFWEVADQLGDKCGTVRAGRREALDPNGKCETRKGIAAYSFAGELDPRLGARRTRASTAWCGRCTWMELGCTPEGSSSP